MEIKTNIKKKQRIMAVVGGDNSGIYIRLAGSKTQCVFIDQIGVGYLINESLEVVSEHETRTAVYEGDSITLIF